MVIHYKNRKLLRILKTKIRLLKIICNVPFYPWSYFFLGREYLNINQPLKAARNFSKAGEMMDKQGHRILKETAYKEAEKVYQNIKINNPSALETKDHGNLGSIDAFLHPFRGKKIFCYQAFNQ